MLRKDVENPSREEAAGSDVHQEGPQSYCGSTVCTGSTVYHSTYIFSYACQSWPLLVSNMILMQNVAQNKKILLSRRQASAVDEGSKSAHHQQMC